MEIIRKTPKRGGHPYIPELEDLYRKGKVSRREFLRHATLLGISMGSAVGFLSACGSPAQPAPAAPAAQATTAPAAGAAAPAAGTPLRGGTMNVATRVMRIDHPARLSWVAPANILRHVTEYLTYTDKNNITQPYLVKQWEPSEDLKTWTLYLQENVTWNNGDPFNADDVVFTFKEWLNEEVGSSMFGLLSYLKPTGIEKKDDLTVVLHLDAPQMAVPEHLFHYPAQVVHDKTFQGDILKNPVGTGPFTIAEYTEGERAVLKRRPDYWKVAADGEPLPYLDELVWIDLGEEISAHVAALKAKQVDRIDFGDSPVDEAYQALKGDPEVDIIPIDTAVSRVLRVRVDKEPWSDNRVRMALKLCQDREKIIALALNGEGTLGGDFHVAPAQADYCEKPIPAYDPERAKALLAEAGFENGLDVQMSVGSGWPDVVSYAEILKEDAAPAGLRIQINAMPNNAYWDVWTEADLGITPWTHRPLGTMVMTLAYSRDSLGNPSSWNETRWMDDEFITLLQQAEGIADLEERRKIVCQLEDIQQERGPIGIAAWRKSWSISSKRFKGVDVHPTAYDMYHEVWKAEA